MEHLLEHGRGLAQTYAKAGEVFRCEAIDKLEAFIATKEKDSAQNVPTFRLSSGHESTTNFSRISLIVADDPIALTYCAVGADSNTRFFSFFPPSFILMASIFTKDTLTELWARINFPPIGGFESASFIHLSLKRIDGAVALAVQAKQSSLMQNLSDAEAFSADFDWC